MGTPLDTVTAEYDSVWKDKLVRWDGAAITYDAIGNMLDNGRGMIFGWTQGRKLSRVTKDGTVSRYVYDHTGMRTKKTVGSTVMEYSYAGRLLLSEKTGNRTNFYHYDSSANLIALTINGTMYFYIRNLQGDVLALVDTAGNTVVEYQYDSWGKPLGITGSKASTVGVQNPFRYRGYYYDNETGLYYLENRYYDSEIKRFICADKINSVKASMETLHNENLYSYCDNNPISRRDESGDIWGVAAIGFVLGMATSVASQMILEKRSLKNINYVDVVTSGITTSLSVIGVPAGLQAGISFVCDIASGVADGNTLGKAVSNAALGIVAASAFGHNFDHNGTDYIDATIKYKKAQKKILDKNLGAIESIPYFVSEAKIYENRMNQIYKVNVQNNLATATYKKVYTARVIGYGCRFDPKNGKRTVYAIYG